MGDEHSAQFTFDAVITRQPNYERDVDLTEASLHVRFPYDISDLRDAS